MKFVYNDGGRKSSGYRGDAGDCFTRAVSIVTGKPYREVYKEVNLWGKDERYMKGRLGIEYILGRGSSARDGVWKKTANEYLRYIGLIWTPCMKVGQGCRVHLRDGELPMGRLLVQVSKHYVAVIDGVIHDTHDCSRNGNRCVYGYWSLPCES